MLLSGLALLIANLLLSSSLAGPSPSLRRNENSVSNGHQHHPLCPINGNISLRFPPTIQSNDSSNWQSPPYAWIFGHWYVRYSSRSAYQKLYNFQSDTYPLFPTDNATAIARVNIDLTSWNLPKTGNATIDNHIYTAFGYDTPLLSEDPLGFAFQFNGTGALSDVSNDWELVGWGYDRNGNAWRVDFETLVKNLPGEEPDFNILSRVENGPDNQIVSEIYAQLHKTFDGTELGVYVANLTELVVDGRRTGTGPVACNEACVNNTNLPSST